MIEYKIVQCDLFHQHVECFVNPWNMNFIPPALLLLQGVSGQMKKRAGKIPFNTLYRHGVMKTGNAFLTSGGMLSQKIIHVSALKWYWVSSLEIVEKCLYSMIDVAQQNHISSIAIPLIGTGVGALKENDVISLMKKTFDEINYSNNLKQDIKIIIVQYART